MFVAQPITAQSAAEALTAPAPPAPATPPSYDAADPHSRVQAAPWTLGTVTPQPAAQPDEESHAWTPFEHYLPAEEQERLAAARQAAETPASAPSAPQTAAQPSPAPERQTYLPAAPDGPTVNLFAAPDPVALRAAADQLLAWADRLDATVTTATE